MITVNSLTNEKGGKYPEYIPENHFGCHFDGNYYYFGEYENDTEFINLVKSVDLTDAQKLSLLKTQRKKEIDDKTELLLIDGFIYQGNRFGLRENEKTKWLALYKAPVSKYPINLVSKEGVIISLSAVTVEAFYESAFDRGRLIEEQGGLLKYRINQCTTIEQVNAIIDNRL